VQKQGRRAPFQASLRPCFLCEYFPVTYPKKGSIVPHNLMQSLGLYNAVVKYEDFARPHMSDTAKAFGVGAKRKEKAFAYMQTLV